MRKLIVPAVAAALLASSMQVYAFSPKVYQLATGVVQSIDRAGQTLKLKGGEEFYLPSDFSNSALSEGDEVKVKYNLRGGKQPVSSVEIIEDH